MSIHTDHVLSRDDWHVNLIKDGGRRVMHGGNAYEDDLEPAATSAEQGQELASAAGSPS